MAALSLACWALVALAERVERQTEPAVRAKTWIVPVGRERAAKNLVADVGFDRPHDGGYRVAAIAIRHHDVVYELRAGAGPDAPLAARLTLLPRQLAAPGDLTSPHHALRPELLDPDPRAAALLAATAASMQARDAQNLFILAPDGVKADLRVAGPAARAQALRALAWLAAAAVPLLIFLLFIRRPRGSPLAARFKLTHLLPATLQLTLFTYWSLYFAGVAEYAAIIGMQIAWAYLVDALVSLARRGRWTVTFGPLPVVLSTDLFLWFAGAHLASAFGVIAIAIASKSLLVRRDGTHIFNPSVLGISAFALAALVIPDAWRYRDIAGELNLPPNMTELILLIALIVQLRIPIVLVSLGGALALSALMSAHVITILIPTWAPVFLVLTLLATDPATIPRTPAGRLLGGLLLGLTMGLTGLALITAGHSDFFAKVVPVLLLNAVAPALDRVARALPALIRAPLAPRLNPAHVLIWVLFIGTSLADGWKASAFEAELHARYETPHVVMDVDGLPTCELNPVFCQPFSFAAELALWRGQSADPQVTPPAPDVAPDPAARPPRVGSGSARLQSLASPPPRLTAAREVPGHHAIAPRRARRRLDSATPAPA
ncbi:MAG: hypothetical protein R3F39_09170 [Myxococcota bacterium]